MNAEAALLAASHNFVVPDMETVKLGGGGVLISDATGYRFFAQSEGYPPRRQFYGHLRAAPGKSPNR